ncbi:MAG: methyltransferase domain-containing protein [Aquabacterium sp.]
MRRFRPARMQQIKDWFPVLNGKGAVLDVGGTWGWWKMMDVPNRDITIVNLDTYHEKEVLAAGYKFSSANGCQLPFADKQFDLAFSNSVIEHVGGLAEQRQFAKELMRCGKEIYLQTPAKCFPIEPHLMAPFIHWLPVGVQRYLVRWLSVWGWATRPNMKQIDEFLAGTRPMTRSEVVSMFPGCEIHTEKFMGLTKSYIVVRRAAR